MIRKLIILLGGLVAAAVVSALVAWQMMNDYLHTPLQLTGDYSLTVPRGATLKSIVAGLEADGVTQNGYWLLVDARRHGTAASIKAGDYTLTPGLTPVQMMALLIAGDVDLERLTIIEGWTAAQAVAALIAHPGVVDDLPVTPLQRADGEAWLDDAAHQALAGVLDLAQPNIEGWLFPDTYQFARGVKASAMLRKMHAQMRSRLAGVWQDVPTESVLDDAYDALILASIVEKETRRADERGIIAGVFERRLNRGMRLQTDPTVIYGIGQAYDGDIRRRDLATDTPYNTYRINGLPPTPIALPGQASLQAVMAPVDGQSLYFVATGDPDGSHFFSATLEEHNEAVNRYLRKLRSR